MSHFASHYGLKQIAHSKAAALLRRSRCVNRHELAFLLAMFFMICGCCVGTVADTKSMPSPAAL